MIDSMSWTSKMPIASSAIPLGFGILKNPYFTTDVSSWASFGTAGTLSWETLEGFSTVGAAKVVATIDGDGMYQDISGLIPGAWYTITFRLKGTVGERQTSKLESPTGTLQSYFADQNGNAINLVHNGAWKLMTASFVAGAAGQARIIAGASTTGAQTSFMDDFDIRYGPIALNDLTYPIEEFLTEVETRLTERERILQHGLLNTNMVLGKRLIHLNGSILGSTSTDYWAKRETLMRAFSQGRFTRTPLGTLSMQLTGLNELIYIDCTLDGYPEIPMAALNPARSNFNINLKAFNPSFVGKEQAISTTTVNASFSHTIGGNYYAFPVIQIYGPITNPIMRRAPLSTGPWEVIDLTGVTLTATQSIVIDFNKRTVIRNDGTDLSGSISAASKWWSLSPFGIYQNWLHLQGTGTTGATFLNVHWRNGYML